MLNRLMEKENNKNIEIARTIKEKNLEVVHYKVDDEVVMTVFKDGLLLTEIRGKYFGVNELNGRTQIDGESSIVDLEKTESNKNFVLEFHKEILLKGAYSTKDNMDTYISDEKYLQHNVDNGIGDGLDQLKLSIDKMYSYGSDLKYDDLELVIAEGNFVFMKNIQHWLNPETNQIEDWQYFDIFRVEKNKIVEHWDILGKVK